MLTTTLLNGVVVYFFIECIPLGILHDVVKTPAHDSLK